MTPLVELVTEVLSFFSLFALAGSVFLLVLILFGKGTSWHSFFVSRAAILSFIVVFFGTASSLFYSEFAHFTPCTLCWWQRVFLYPQVILFAIVIWKRYKNAWRFSLPLSVAGALVAFYQVYLQFGGALSGLCSSEDVVSCSKRYFLAYGFITIPTMAAIAFVLLILFQIFDWQGRKEEINRPLS